MEGGEKWVIKKSELEQEVYNLKAENKKCYDLIIKLSKSEANKNIQSLGLQNVYDLDTSSPLKNSKWCTAEGQEEKVAHKRIRVLT